MKRGALIVLEGVDRAGKSTQAKKLVESLIKRDIPAELITFPDRTTHTGKLISQYLSDSNCKIDDHAINLLFTANRWENADKMRKKIAEGTTLIVDRYSYSGIAFSSAKKGLDMEWCKHPENGLPKPDLVFLLTLSPEEMEKRPGFGKERYETLSFQERVTAAYKELIDETWKVVDACGTIENVHGRLLKDVVEKIGRVGSVSLGTLDFGKSGAKMKSIS